jgi:hypothetical protein
MKKPPGKLVVGLPFGGRFCVGRRGYVMFNALRVWISGVLLMLFMGGAGLMGVVVGLGIAKAEKKSYYKQSNRG